jgi:PAS domain-containing protein
MAEQNDWTFEFPAAITVTDEEGTILSMNLAAREVFAADGGAGLVGTSVLACHPEPSRTKVAGMLAGWDANHYTIAKEGRRKIIHQMPWFRGGRPAGLVEISIPIPEEIPHFDRG